MSENKIAVVTGANRGIGFAVAKGLLKKGVKVIVTSRKEEDGRKAMDELAEHGEAIYHQLDVTDMGSIKRLVAFLEEQFGKLDILINNAGINYDTWQNTVNADLDEVRDTIETNLMAPWQIIQEMLPLLRKSNGANIVNVSSGAGSLASQTGDRPGYSISKLALNGLTLQFSRLLKDDKILINSVCPGWVRTDMGGDNANRSPDEGAETIIWAALLDQHGPSGGFFRDRESLQF